MIHDDRTESPLEDEERQRLRDLLRAHQNRLQVPELQQATQGIQTPPHVITEIGVILAAFASDVSGWYTAREQVVVRGGLSEA